MVSFRDHHSTGSDLKDGIIDRQTDADAQGEPFGKDHKEKKRRGLVALSESRISN
jgi:hypothetical protein